MIEDASAVAVDEDLFCQVVLSKLTVSFSESAEWVC